MEIDLFERRLRRCKCTKRFVQKILCLQTLLPFGIFDIFRFYDLAVLEDDRARIIAPDIPDLRA